MVAVAVKCMKSSMVRMAALEALIELCNRGTLSTLLPVQKGVIRVVRDALDDPKRDVREIAAKCHARWVLLTYAALQPPRTDERPEPRSADVPEPVAEQP